MRELGYSDAAAGRRIGAVRLCVDQPGARERLRKSEPAPAAKEQATPEPGHAAAVQDAAIWPARLGTLPVGGEAIEWPSSRRVGR